MVSRSRSLILSYSYYFVSICIFLDNLFVPGYSLTMTEVAKRPNGRPSKLTPKLQENICELLAKGNYFTTACEAVGISVECQQNWMRLATTGAEPYLSFSLAVKNAQAQAEDALLSRIRDVGMNPETQNWPAAAWILERTRPQKFGRLDRRQIDISGETNVNVSIQKIVLSEAIREVPDLIEGGAGD